MLMKDGARVVIPQSGDCHLRGRSREATPNEGS